MGAGAAEELEAEEGRAEVERVGGDWAVVEEASVEIEEGAREEGGEEETRVVLRERGGGTNKRSTRTR